MSRARVAVAVVVGVAIGACASGGKVLPPQGNTTYGVYRFHEVLTSAHPPVTLEGSVAVLPDTVTISLASSPCALTSASRGNTETLSYACGDYSFFFDRRNPLRDNSYRVPTVTYTTNRFCISTTFDYQGREICMKYGTERVEKSSMISGKLRFVGQ